MRGAEVQTKLARVRAWMREQSAAAVLLESTAAFAWVTGGGRGWVATDTEASVASVLITADDAWVITSTIEAGRMAEEELRDLPLEVVAVPWHVEGAVLDAVRQRADPTSTLSDLGRAGLPRRSLGLQRLRYRLGEAETARLETLGRDAARAVEQVARSARPGDSERELAGELAHRCVSCGIAPTVVLVGTDERIDRYRHPLPTEVRLRQRALIALTGRRDGLHVALTRMVVRSRAEPELVARHRAVARVDAVLLAASRPGRAWSEALAAGLEQYAREGFPDEWMRHHQGGLTGYAGREIKVTPDTRGAIEEGNAVAWNPTLPGVKSEDTAVVAGVGPRLVTSTTSWPAYAEGLEAGRPGLLVD